MTRNRRLPKAASEESTEISSYEEIRRQKIARNAQVLESLGLKSPILAGFSLPGPVPSLLPNIVKGEGVFAGRKRRRTLKESYDSGSAVDGSYLRRSLRNAEKPAICYKDDGADAANDAGRNASHRMTTRARRGRDLSDGGQKNGAISSIHHDAEDRKTLTEARQRKKTAGAPKSRPEPSYDSVLALDADTELIVSPTVLGEQFPTLGKDTVIRSLCHRKDITPRFSKMSGTTEWRNCIFLWVNIGGKDYENVFERRSRKLGGDIAEGDGDCQRLPSHEDNETMTMTWFCSSRYTEESPLVQQLLPSPAAAREDQNSEEEDGVGPVSEANEGTRIANCESGLRKEVFLFCRVLGEPYVGCGRLRYVTHSSHSHPISFLWRLQDYEQLSKCQAARRIFEWKASRR